ncbi:hypothetical protein P3S68_021625 [Capsicum galapagoense]
MPFVWCNVMYSDGAALHPGWRNEKMLEACKKNHIHITGRVAEIQTSRMRLEYIKSVLRQEVGFFDTQATESSTTYQVISTVSADSTTIQITIHEKVAENPISLAKVESAIL